jgi:1,2-phenylacetyl-CoA epoxidase catalytic subunit
MAPDALRPLLIACADTKLLLGYHYGEWTFGTPELEAAVASCSLSQGEMGHVRLLHAVLKKGWGDNPDALVEDRDPATFANVAFLDSPLPDWPAFVAANAVVDLAMTRLLHSMRASAYEPVRVNIEKILEEERYHAHHGRGWFRTLAARADSRPGLLAAAGAALAACAAWFGPEGESGDAALVAGGFKDAANPDLFHAVNADLRTMAEAAGCVLPSVVPPSFTGWDPATRRLPGTAPDEEILYHLRGTRNAMFKLN